MRQVVAAAILALPSLVSAQAVHSVSHLLAAADAPAFAFQASAVKASMPRVFTGLIAPVRLTSLQLRPTAAPLPTGEVVVSYTVDTDGVPENIQVVKALDEVATTRVVDAVRRMRYTPGQLDGEAVATPVLLRVAFTK